MNDLEIIGRESTAMLEQAKELRVSCDEEYALAGEFIMGCKALVKKITAAHAENIERWHAGHKAAIADRDKDLNPVNQALGIASGAALVYKREQDRLAKEEAARIAAENLQLEEERRLKEAEELEAKGDIKAAEEVIAAPLPVERAFKPASVVPKVAGLSTQKRWKGRIVQPSKVKRDYCLPDQTLVNYAVQRAFQFVKDPTPEQKKAIEEEIGGVEIYLEEVFAGRVARQ